MLDGGFPLKKAVTHVRFLKVTLYVNENLIFKLAKSRRVNIQKTLRLKTNSKLSIWMEILTKQKQKCWQRDICNPKREKKREQKT